MQSKNIKYLPAIDQLRGLAALLIVFYHGLTLISYQLIHNSQFTFNNWLKAESVFSAILIEGHTAVSLFMVLSGFIFTIGSYKKEISYSSFITNRFLRTYPLFLLMLFAGLSVSPQSFNFQGFLQTIFFLGNYPNSINIAPFTSMFWAVAVEWQFYLIFPFLLHVTNRYGLRYLGGIIFIMIIFRSLSYLNGGDIHTISYWSIIGRLDQFIIGMIIGVLYRTSFTRSLKTSLLILPSSVAILFSLYIFNKLGGWPSTTPMKVLWPTIEASVWGVFILGYLSFAYQLPNFLGKLLSNTGTISYSIYLMHFIIISLCIKYNYILTIFPDRHLVNALLTTALIVTPITIVLSIFSYHYVEKPFLNMRRKY